MGRPTDYTPEKAAIICELIASTPKRLSQLCDLHDELPTAKTVWQWLAKYKEFREMYALAREQQSECLAEEILEISDDGRNDTYTDDEGNVKTDWDVLGRSKLRVDTRKWLLAKLSPRKYGELIKNEISSPDGSLRSMNDDQVKLKIESILRKGIERKAKAEDDGNDLC